MGIVKLVKPNDITTFTFEWITEDERMKVTRQVGEMGLTVYNYAKPKARVFWCELTSRGYKPS